MNKKYLSILVIVITLILSVYMIVSQNTKNNDFTLVDSAKKSDAELTNSNLDTKIEEFLKNIENNKIVSEEKEVENEADSIKENDSQDDNTSTENEELEDTTGENLLESIEGLVQEDKIEFIDNTESEIFSDKEDVQTSMPVFKIDKMLILDDMSFYDKATITKMIAKLSMQDYAMILDSIKKYGELECVEKINHILKSRLENDDYKIIEEIFDKYINLELIN